MTELDQLLAMFDRCGIPYQRYDNARDNEVEISVSPERREEGAQRGPLTGAHWASTDYYFNGDGQLTRIWMEGD